MTEEEIRYMAEKTPGWEYEVFGNGFVLVHMERSFYHTNDSLLLKEVYLPLLITQCADSLGVGLCRDFGQTTWRWFQDRAMMSKKYYPTAQEARIAGIRYLMEVRK